MNIIPLPARIQEKSGSVALGKDSVITGAFENSQSLLKEFLSTRAGGENCKVIFVLDGALHDEEYLIACNHDEVLIRAKTECGAFYSVMTMQQLFTQEGLQRVSIEDKPNFEHRGFSLDCSRHFWRVDKIKQILDVMAHLKMNKFHWHLTDDQGWRAEIKKYPLLTQKGAIRKRTPLSVKAFMGSGDWGFDEIEYGRGLFYTQDDMKDIVAYAKERHIEVIPEIDMPGHMVAAISCYPYLSCTGEKVDVSDRWGVMDNICCCGKDDVYDFAKDVIDELCEIFDGKFFHIGGDEVPKTRWKKCPHCQAKIKELGLKDENALQGYFNNEIAKYLRLKGKRMIGWNEVLDAKDIMDNDVVAQWWTKHCRGNKNEFDWMANGGKCILSLTKYVYMDHPFNVRPLKKTYNYSPKDMGVRDEANIFGMEIPQWVEFIRDERKLDMLTYARLVAFSEACWTKREDRNYSDFETRMENLRPFLDKLGCKICPPEFYRGKIYPRKAFSYALKWKSWSEEPDYEFNQLVKLQDAEYKK
ncbi:MAG: beta-N-acetylhexosaminidase [Clostridia bacterium]|nr:beta-N-acetylhexosaminidase [Clostridia bacterium]